ncbi:Site-specific recombinase XerD [Malonomonas rubra DSM 5091]|uniref:Site-specific recombinase XerD n=1 Tax=Malonomonas rubra DSM 5091 TaxID=1122189 RepID=A0A1M6L6B3_MALRU|nr:integrase domain-containing protein [Malonomonas rubra]SHJ66730.1 Site-specific recombinase XerD [Malonomonas rubra DSM 5091]
MKCGSEKNNGWGTPLIWACLQALKHRYGKGCYATLATHKAHLTHFAKYLKAHNINDIMRVSVEVLLAYATCVQEKHSNNYARNLISSANIIVESVRGDRKVRLDPSEVLARRQSARKDAPAGLNLDDVNRAAESLTENGYPRIAVLILLIRHFGMRLKEGCLIDLRVALRQAKKHGKIDVRRGTKGGRGRTIERWVPATEQAIEVLVQAQAFSSKETGSLIPSDMSSVEFMRLAKRVWRKVRKEFGLSKIHDLRSAFACDRYKQLTGHDAPACHRGNLSATKEQDRKARDVIVKEIGHGSRGRMAPYVGRGAR